MMQNLEKNTRIIYNTLEIIITFKYQAFLCDLVGIYHIVDEVASFEHPSMRYNELIVLKLDVRTPSLRLPIISVTLALSTKSCVRLWTWK